MSTSPTIDDIRAALPADYAIANHLASGGQGAVFKGSYNGNSAAIKVFYPGADDRRVARELRLLQQINKCPTLVGVMATSTILVAGMTCPLVAYTYHDGGDLSQLLARTCPPIAVDQILHIGACASDAVNALWKHRIVHRDIKPANIVKESETEFVLVDVGLARHLDLSDITVPGGVAGTRGYMSPEQARGRRSLTISSDYFSLGISLYELATKVHPFNRQQHLVGLYSPKPIQSVRPDIPAPLAKVIHHMMNGVPSRRLKPTGDTFRNLIGKT